MSSSRLVRLMLADEAMLFLGYPSLHYKGPLYGQDVAGFDCSGYLKFLLKRLSFPDVGDTRHANEFFDRFGVLIHAEAVSRGDLIFFSRNGIVPTHIGIMLSEKEYIHAPGINDSCICTCTVCEESIANSRVDKIYHRNPIGYKRLAIRNGRYSRVL